jgi:hypothetical protein
VCSLGKSEAFHNELEKTSEPPEKDVDSIFLMIRIVVTQKGAHRLETFAACPAIGIGNGARPKRGTSRRRRGSASGPDMAR